MGSVVTFYSYKGGVGRTFVTTNIAVCLAQWGFRVLVMDWDLEAPGLYDYFKSKDDFQATPPARGIVEYITEISEGLPANWRDYVSTLEMQASGTKLDVIWAARNSPDYIADLQKISWRDLTQSQRLLDVLDAARTDWKSEYDFVLIDSRTGITDSGGLCTIFFPDMLVFLFTANNQSLTGVIQTVKGSLEVRSQLPFTRGALATIPVVCRFESNQEYDESRAWMGRFRSQLAEFYEGWAPRLDPLSFEDVVQRIIERTTIPYFAKWSFGEPLPILIESQSTATQLVSFYLKTLAAVIANNRGHAKLLVENTDGYIDTAKREGQRRRQAGFDCGIIEDEDTRQFAHDLKDELSSFGATCVLVDPANSTKTLAVSGSLLVPVMTANSPQRAAVGDMISHYLQQNLQDSHARTILPILSPKISARSIPAHIRNHPRVTGESSSRALALQVLAKIGKPPGVHHRVTLRGHSDVILKIVWSPDGNYLCTCSVDTTARIWNLQGDLVAILGDHGFGVNDAVCNVEQSKVATVAYSGYVHVWDVATWERAYTFQAHQSDTPAMARSNDGLFLATGCDTGEVAIWDVQNTSEVKRMVIAAKTITKICWWQGGQAFLVASLDGTVWAVPPLGGDPQLCLNVQSPIVDLALAPNESFVATADFAGRVSLFKTGDRYPLGVKSTYSNLGRSPAFRGITISFDSQLVAGSCSDGSVYLWKTDATLSEPISLIDEPVSDFWPGRLAFSPTQNVLATFGEEDRVARLWTIENQELTH